MPLVHILLLILFSYPSLVGATVLSDAVATCTTLDSYCNLSAASASLDSAIPLNLVDSGGGQNILEYAPTGVFSRRDGKLLFRGAGHFQTPYIITYTESTNTWTKTQHGTTGADNHTYDGLTLNPLMGRWYRKPDTSCNTIRRYSLSDNTEITPAFSWSFGNSTCYSGAEYFPDIGEVVFFGLESGTNYGFFGCVDSVGGSGTCTRISGAIDIGSADAQAVYNPMHRIMLFTGSNQKVWKLDQSKTFTQMANAPCNLLVSNPGFGILTVDPVSGDYIALCPTGPTYKFDVTNGATGTWTQIIESNAPFFNASTGNGYFSIIGITDQKHGGILFLECGGTSNCRSGSKPRLWFLRHTTSTTYDVKHSSPGVVYSEVFDRARDRLYYADAGADGTNCSSALSAAGLQRGFGFNSAHAGPGNTGPTGVGGCHWPTAQTSIRHIKGGALQLTIPSGANSSNTTGSTEWFVRRGDGTFFYVSPSSPWSNILYVQFYVRFDSGLLGATTTCTGGCYGFKHIILYGEPPNGSNSSTIETTTVLYQNGSSPTTNKAVPAMYGQQGHDASYYNYRNTDTSIGPQPEVNCTFANVNGTPTAPCRILSPNTWYEFTYKITVTAPSSYQAYCSGGARSRVEFWIDGVKYVDNQCASIQIGASDGAGMGSGVLTNYLTNMTGITIGGGAGSANSYTTELIMSTSAICMVGEACTGGGGGDTTPPAAPTNLRVQ